MPLEAATYISDLNTSNPAASDQLAQGDDHLRLIKSALKTTFPNVTGAVTATHTRLNNRDVGSIVAFPKAPTGLLSGGTAGAGTYLECDGSAYLIADHPDLAAFYGTTFGGNGTTTFGVPDLKTAGRYLRSRTSLVTVGTTQANQNKSHTHTYSGSSTTGLENQGISVSVSGVTGTSNQSLDHVHPSGVNISAAQGTINPAGFFYSHSGGVTGAASSAGYDLTSHTHSFSASGAVTANHNHTFSWSGTTSTGSADGTEARPETFVVIYCVKT